MGDAGMAAEAAYVEMASGAPTEDALAPGQSSMWRVVGNFVNTVVGAGIVGLPYTLKRGGFWSGLAMMGFACVMTHYSVSLMLRSAIALRVNTYEHLAQASFGAWGFYSVTFSLLVFDFGACLSYLIILADSMSRALAQAWPDLGRHDGVLHDAVVLCASPFLLALVLQRDLSSLERFSFLSVLLVCLLSGYVAWGYATRDVPGAVEPMASEPLPLLSPGIFSAFGTIAFAFVNNDAAFLLYNTLRRPSERRWVKLSRASFALALAICALFAAFGYLSFRDEVSDNLLNDYASDDPAVMAVRVAYAVTMMLTFPTTFFVVRHVCNELLFRHTEDHGTVQANSTARHLLLTLPIFAASVAITIARVSLGFVMSFTGGVAAVLLAFVVPPAVWIKTNPSSYSPIVWRNTGAVWKSCVELGPALFMLAFGMIMMIVSPVQAVVCEFWPDVSKTLC
mmetsp:Transcript_17036/g.46010  ORF Transcript_17036/g.46010 Transcript_17036/m.46010 type:complete len:452 (-) Transcript_17036:199-1554(-)